MKFTQNFFKSWLRFFKIFHEISLNTSKIIIHFTFSQVLYKIHQNFLEIFLLPPVNFSRNFIKLSNFFLIFWKVTSKFGKFYMKFEQFYT